MKKFLSFVIMSMFLFTLFISPMSLSAKSEEQEPLYTIACFSDLHVDYGIQYWETPIRKTTIRAVNFVKDELGGADLVMIGGDITSQNDKNIPWTEEAVNNTRDCVHNTVSQASKNGEVLYVTGNHDSQASVAAGGGFWSGDYEKYMKDELGDYDAAFFNEDNRYEELLCYRYNINGLEFIGINTPSIADASNVTYLSQIEWVAAELEKIGKDKTVIILCHYPVSSLTDPAAGENDAETLMKETLKNYPNVIYCYGHVHGSDKRYVWYETEELAYVTDSGYIACHMGSMGYYKNQFQPDWLSAEEPLIVQLMMISFYSDHIEFQMYNVGDMSGDPEVYELKSFTVERNMEAQIKADFPLITVVIVAAAVAIAAGVVFILVKYRGRNQKLRC